MLFLSNLLEVVVLRRYIQRIFVKLFFMVHLHHMNEHKEFHTNRLKPIGNNIRASWTKSGESSKNLTFSNFHDFFYADLFSGFLWNFFSWFTYTIWTNTRSFIPTDWNQPEIIFEQVGQKQENRPKIWLFTIFTIFFTPIYSADFCEILFHGSSIPNKRIKKKLHTYSSWRIGNNTRES